MSNVEFFFDYSCPWTYMAFTRLRDVAARTGSTIVWRPVMVDRVRREVNPSCAASREDPEPRRARYQLKDLQDWAEFCGLKISKPDDWPPDTELALSGGVLAAETKLMATYSESIFRAYFADGLDISDRDVVVEIAYSAGLAEITDRIGTEDPVARVRANEAELLTRGGFGSPTIFVGEEMFFGNDRMPLVEFAVGQASGRRFVMPGQHG